MAKDEISKQLEELKKYVEEQKKREAAAEHQKLRQAEESSFRENALVTEDPDLYDEEAVGEFEAEDAVSESSMHESATPVQRTAVTAGGAGVPGKKKGCGCFTFIVVMLALSFIIPMIAGIIKRHHKKSSYNKQSESRSAAAAQNAIETMQASGMVPEEYNDDSIPVIAVSGGMAEEEINMKYALSEQKKEIEKSLAAYKSSEPGFSQQLPQDIRKKRFSSTDEKEKFFSDCYDSIVSGKKKYDSRTAEAVLFFLNYSRLELAYEGTSRELDRLSGK